MAGSTVSAGSSAASSARLTIVMPSRLGENYGNATVQLLAPGYVILSTVTGDLYQLMNGTSMATPTVTGAAALLPIQWASLPLCAVSWRTTLRLFVV